MRAPGSFPWGRVEWKCWGSAVLGRTGERLLSSAFGWQPRALQGSIAGGVCLLERPRLSVLVRPRADIE